jgi:hypothetical protein
MINIQVKSNQGGAPASFTATENDAAEANSINASVKNAVTEFGQTLIPTGSYGLDDEYQSAKAMLLAAAYSLPNSASTGSQLVFSSAGASGSSLPEYSTLKNGDIFKFTCTANSTGSMTVDWDSTVIALKLMDGSDPINGSLYTGYTYLLLYDSSTPRFRIYEPYFPSMIDTIGQLAQLAYISSAGTLTRSGGILVDPASGDISFSVPIVSDLTTERHDIRGAAADIGYASVSTTWDYDWADGHSSVSYCKFNDTVVYGSNCYGHETSTTQLRLFTTGSCSAIIITDGKIYNIHYTGTAAAAFTFATYATLATSVTRTEMIHPLYFEPTPETAASASNSEFFLDSAEADHLSRKASNGTVTPIGLLPYWGKFFYYDNSNYNTSCAVTNTWYALGLGAYTGTNGNGVTSTGTDTELLFTLTNMGAGDGNFEIEYGLTAGTVSSPNETYEIGYDVNTGGGYSGTPTILEAHSMQDLTTANLGTEMRGSFSLLGIDSGWKIKLYVRNTVGTKAIEIWKLYMLVRPLS